MLKLAFLSIVSLFQAKIECVSPFSASDGLRIDVDLPDDLPNVPLAWIPQLEPTDLTVRSDAAACGRGLLPGNQCRMKV